MYWWARGGCKVLFLKCRRHEYRRLAVAYFLYVTSSSPLMDPAIRLGKGMHILIVVWQMLAASQCG